MALGVTVLRQIRLRGPGDACVTVTVDAEGQVNGWGISGQMEVRALTTEFFQALVDAGVAVMEEASRGRK
jgi:hypothetical protein